MKEKLEAKLRDMEDWEKTATTVPGVKIIKIPENKFTPARLAIEMIPVDDKGKQLKKKGILVISNKDLFDRYKKLFENEKVIELINSIDQLRDSLPKKEEIETSEDTFEI
jgi:hypothetical protein